MGAAILHALCPGSTSPGASALPGPDPPPAPILRRGGGPGEAPGEARLPRVGEAVRGLEAEPRAPAEGCRPPIQRRPTQWGRAAGQARLGESRRLSRAEPRVPGGAAGLGEGDLVRPAGSWGLLPDCTWPGLLPSPSRLGPELGLRGGPPGRMFSTARYVWSGPCAACRLGNKTRAVARPEPRPAGAWWGEGMWGWRAVALVRRAQAPLGFIRVTARLPAPTGLFSLVLGCCWPFP